ncbi:insulin gene enhancer protein ISL-1-like [Styela clava]|uniref:insulin gene enhancer protein ISL-1-like n=1 Tax=Styela clava TaxID=7725 RepID=UPI00193A2BC1|nr:insulin gene enhancer protein ISL-1-like [Styela clava]
MGDPSQNGHGCNMNCAVDPNRIPLCVGCGTPIHDQYILRVAPNLEWHAGCLKCTDCGQHLDETRTCFVRDGKTYCKQDYIMLFGTKCNKCGLGFTKNDFVMRARNKIYHIECFRCIACNRQLIPGDEFALGDEGLFCKADHVERSVLHTDMLGLQGDPHMTPGLSPMGMQNGGVLSPVMGGVVPPGHMGNGTPGGSSASSGGSSAGGRRSHKDPKTTRVRTVLNEKQLHTLRTCYAANPRPDALMKEQLVEMTGLSPRVIRVWFQNKRCKDKKRAIAMKQMQDQHQNPHQHQDGDQIMSNGVHGLSGMHGVPMVASEPVRNDNGVNAKPVEVRNYQQPAWKALSDFALQTEIDQPFQQLVNNFSDQGQGSMSDSSDISSIPSVSSALTSCSTPMTSQDINVSVCS